MMIIIIPNSLHLVSDTENNNSLIKFSQYFGLTFSSPEGNDKNINTI